MTVIMRFHCIMLSIMLATLTVLCIYARAVCVSDNDGAIVEPTQPTESRCDRPQCSILEKLNPLTKSSYKIRFCMKKKD